jgi:hypothetical protein
LVRHRERADLLDLVAPELHPHGVLLGRWEDVHEAAANGELAPLLDQVDPGVRRVGEPSYDVVERHLVARGQLDRFEVAEPRDLRLEDRAHRRGHDPDASGAGPRLGVTQATQHGQSTTDGVAAGAEPLVGQRLPAREVGDAGGVHQRGQLGGQLLGLAPRGRDQQHRAAGPDQAVDEEGPHPGGRGEVERADARRVAQRLGERGLGENGVGQCRQDHGRTPRWLGGGGPRDSTTAPNRRAVGVRCPTIVRAPPPSGLPPRAPRRHAPGHLSAVYQKF